MKEIQFQVRIADREYCVIDNCPYIQQEDILDQKYWYCLWDEYECYEDLAFELFKYLYYTLNDPEIPKEIFESFADEIYWQTIDDIEKLLFEIENIGIDRFELLIRTKASLEQLKTVLQEYQFKQNKYSKELLKFIEGL